MRILVTGAGGMLGRAVALNCRVRGDEVFAHDHASLDITDSARVAEVFARARPDAVINCAAWTDVDGCELDPERAFKVNSEAVEILAAGSRSVAASFVTVSTDYVFDGDKQGFYTQRDDPRPQSHYGRAKLEGERRALAATARCTVVRSGWIFGEGGRNFLSRVVALARGGARLAAITDAYGTPTSAVDLAARLRLLAELDLPGVYHVVNAGEGASFYEFAAAALADAGLDRAAPLERVTMDSLDRPAPRPRNSRLRCLVSEAVGLAPLRDWRDALGAFVRGECE
jgi:dTDP-4-dehydrorhamnose reductase